MWARQSRLPPPSPFTVGADGPFAVCSMAFAGQTLTSAPFTFTFDPSADSHGYGSSQVAVSLCNDEGDDQVWIDAQAPFDLGRSVLNDDGSGRADAFVRNSTPSPATATLTNAKGAVVASVEVAANDAADVSVSAKGITRSSRYTLTMSGQDGLTMSKSVVIPIGWTPDFGVDIFAPCSTVKWSFDKKGQPRNAGGMEKDIMSALALISRTTGLTFVRTRDPAEAYNRFVWSRLGAHGPSGIGWTDGQVEINSQDWWTTDAYAGMGSRHSTPADRGWLVVHEVLHTLGFGHTNARQAIMNPINHGQHVFTRDELDGLRILYPKAGCS